MSQHDFNIANQTSGNARTDLNNALAALATLSSGATAPATTFANMLWYDTANDALKLRNEADSGWIVVAYINQSTAKLELADDTSIVSAVGTQTGLLGGQSTATWEAGTGTTESLVSPANVKAAIDALVSVDTSSVLTATAGASVGAVGTYGFFFNTNYVVDPNNVTTTKDPGYVEAGSNLRYSGADPELSAVNSYGTAPSGTWRLMGYFLYRENSSNVQTLAPRYSVYLRIA